VCAWMLMCSLDGYGRVEDVDAMRHVQFSFVASQQLCGLYIDAATLLFVQM
jgi:hypothetical protein